MSGSDPFHTSYGAGEAGMGYVCVMKPGFWSSFHNQALLPAAGTTSFGINYQSRFNIKELSTRSAGMTMPAGKAALGLVYSLFGYPDFRREMAGLACGLKLSENISAGVQADYFAEKTYGEYENHQSVTCEAGILISTNEAIRIGIHIFNPLPVLGISNNWPSTIRAGAGSFLNKLLFAGIEAEMSTGTRLKVKTGFEYEAVKRLKLRGGFSTENTSFCFGVGYNIETVILDISFNTHETLGVTPSASLIFKIK